MSRCATTWFRAVLGFAMALACSPAIAQVCSSEQFDYPDSPINGVGGWTVTVQDNAGQPVANPADISVSSNKVEIRAGSPGTTSIVRADKAVSCPPCESGILTVSLKITGDASGNNSTLWGIYFDDANGKNLARFYGGSLSAIARTSGLSLGYLSNPATLTGSAPDELKAVIDTVNHRTTYYLNGVLLPIDPPNRVNPISHGVDAGTSQVGLLNAIGRIRLERQAGAASTGVITIDDIKIEACEGTCSASVTPTATQRSFARAGQPATPASFDYTVLNNNQDSISYTVAEVDATGAPFDHPWLTLETPSGAQLASSESEVLTASLDTTGLTAGAYVGYLKFTDSCTPGRSYTRAIKLLVDECLTEGFAYVDGPLDTKPGWTGPPIGVTHPIEIVGGAVKITGGSWGTLGSTISPSVSHVIPDDCPSCQTNGKVSAKIRVQAGSGTSNMWSVYFDSPTGVNFARWTGSATKVRGRIGGTGHVTPEVNLSGPGTWDELEVIIDTTADTSQFFINGVDQGQLFHNVPLDGNPEPGDRVAVVRFERIHNAGAAGNSLLFDDVQVSRCVLFCNDPVFDVRNITGDVAMDDHVTVHDFLVFKSCVTGPAPAAADFDALSFECRCMDTNGDRGIDQDDFGGFQRCYTGPTITVNPNCDD